MLNRPRTIRPAQPGDAAALIRVIDTVAREGRWLLRNSFDPPVEVEADYLANLGVQEGLYLVALAGDDLIGWLILTRGSFEYNHHSAEIGMGLLSSYRGMGIGTALLQEAIAWARRAGLEKLCLGVRASNLPAQALYRKLGFAEEGRRSRQLKTAAGYDDELLMALFL